MLTVQNSNVLDCCNISFGHMIRIENYKEQVFSVLKEFKEEKILINNGINKGHLTILLNGYGKATLEEMNNIVSYVQEQLDEECTFAMEFRDIQEISDFIHITLIRSK